MTPAELNRDIKKLAKNAAFMNEDERRKEFMRLYRADSEFIYMNANSVKWMLRLNVKYRFEALHIFGINIALPGELGANVNDFVKTIKNNLV